MRVAIKVQDNLKEILEFLEEKGYKWSSGDLPTAGISWGSKIIIVSGKTLTHKSISTYEPDTVTFEQFKKELTMKINKILPGYKLALKNGNVFVVMEYKSTKIVFPEGSNRSFMKLDELCDENLNPKNNMAQIVAVLNSINVPIWERVFTRTDIQPGFTMVNKDGVHYLVVECGNTLRIMSTKYFLVGARLCDIMNEDMTPARAINAAIVEVKDKEGKIVYKKK